MLLGDHPISVYPEVLSVEQLASLFHCSVKSIRQIPNDELPRYVGPGRKHLFLKDDAIHYLRRGKKLNLAADELMRDIESEVLDFSADSECGRSRRNGKRHV